MREASFLCGKVWFSCPFGGLGYDLVIMLKKPQRRLSGWLAGVTLPLILASTVCSAAVIDLVNQLGLQKNDDTGLKELRISKVDLSGDGKVTADVVLRASGGTLHAAPGTKGGAGMGVVGGEDDQVNAGESITVEFSQLKGCDGVEIVALGSGFVDGAGATVDGEVLVKWKGVRSGKPPKRVVGDGTIYTPIGGNAVLKEGGSVTFAGNAASESRFRVTSLEVIPVTKKGVAVVSPEKKVDAVVVKPTKKTKVAVKPQVPSAEVNVVKKKPVPTAAALVHFGGVTLVVEN
jgi:hypothetical protein